MLSIYLLFIKNMQNMGVEISDSLIPAKRSPEIKIGFADWDALKC